MISGSGERRKVFQVDTYIDHIPPTPAGRDNEVAVQRRLLINLSHFGFSIPVGKRRLVQERPDGSFTDK